VKRRGLSKRTVAPPDASTVLCACAFLHAVQSHVISLSQSKNFCRRRTVSEPCHLVHKLFEKTSHCRAKLSRKKNSLLLTSCRGRCRLVHKPSKMFLSVALPCRGRKTILSQVNCRGRCRLVHKLFKKFSMSRQVVAEEILFIAGELSRAVSFGSWTFQKHFSLSRYHVAGGKLFCCR
jgi:hypothetical protein